MDNKPPSTVVNFVVERTGVDQRQIRKYLSYVDSPVGRQLSKGNPKVDAAVQIACGLRDLSPYASPLCMLYQVPQFKPHFWGVVGHMCSPGPERPILEIWPAIRWMILPNASITEEAFAILQSSAFYDAFDRAWKSWSEANSTARFPDALSDAIDHARETPPEMWNLSDSDVEAWAEWVTRDPSSFGLGMRMLEGRSLCARSEFERAIEHWEKYKRIDGNSIMIHRPYLIHLIESEQRDLRSRVKAIFESQDEWRSLADWLD